MEADSILGDLEVARSPKSGRKAEDALVDEAWRLWARLTSRPDPRTPDRAFSKEYRSMLQAHFPHERLLRNVEGAARMRPRGRDPRDTRRVTRVLTNYNAEAEAEALLRDDAPIHAWPFRDEAQPLCLISDVEELCGTRHQDWVPREGEAAGILVSTLDREALERATTRTRMASGIQGLMPSDVLRWSSVWRDPESAPPDVARSAGRDTYHAGRDEASQLEGVDLGVDSAASRMLMRGTAASEVRRFHLMAPDGYWEAVDEWLDQRPGERVDSAYMALKEEWGWSPEMREMLD